MTQTDAQIILALIGLATSMGIAISSVDYRVSKWWWAVPAFLIAPLFVRIYVTAVLG